MSKLSRAIRFIIAIWILALCLAAPQAMQFGVEYMEIPEGAAIPSMCTLVTEGLFDHAFEISTFLFFAIPMTMITVLYVLIAVQLRKSRLLSMRRRAAGGAHSSPGQQSAENRSSRTTAAQNRVVKMLGKLKYFGNKDDIHFIIEVTFLEKKVQLILMHTSRAMKNMLFCRINCCIQK